MRDQSCSQLLYYVRVKEWRLNRPLILTNSSPLARLISVSLPPAFLVFPVSAGLTTDRCWITVSDWKTSWKIQHLKLTRNVPYFTDTSISSFASWLWTSTFQLSSAVHSRDLLIYLLFVEIVPNFTNVQFSCQGKISEAPRTCCSPDNKLFRLIILHEITHFNFDVNKILHVNYLSFEVLVGVFCTHWKEQATCCPCSQHLC